MTGGVRSILPMPSLSTSSNTVAPEVTRFAPSPTGLLHLGHALSALVAWSAARQSGGRFLVRIEDIDIRRCKPEFEDAILEDLAWLGMDWDGDVRRQSEHFDDYSPVLDRLTDRGLIYPCFCTRAQIAQEIAGSAAAPHGPDGPLYPGTCRSLPAADRRERLDRGVEFCLRLDAAKAASVAGDYVFEEAGDIVTGQPLLFGDVVLARKDTPTSYHLSVTVDDHLQGVTLVTRGVDLLPATHVHALLQRLLGYATPRYRHHRLLTDEQGRRFAKRDRAVTLRALRQAGVRPHDIWRRVGFEPPH